MGFFVYSFKLLERGMGVYFRRRDALMAQQPFYAFYACAVVQHRRGESMSQHMGRQLFEGAHLRQVFLHLAADLLRSHPATFLRQEECIVQTIHLTIADKQVMPEILLQFFAERNKTLFIALSGYFQLISGKIY